MTKRLITKMMLIYVLLASFSCRKNEIVDNPTLTLSEQTLQLPNTVSEKSITITTNQSEWTAIANADWIHLTQSGNTLNIKTDANPLPEKRTAEVAVFAGIGRKITIEQEGSKGSIATVPEKIESDQWGGEYTLYINANNPNWEVTSDVEWIKVVPQKFRGVAIVNIAENTSREPREAKLTFKSADTYYEFLITQSGILYYVMPCLNFLTSEKEIRDFEANRKSELIDRPDGFFNNDYWTFSIKTPIYKVVRYRMYEGLYASSFLFASNKDIFKKEMTEIIKDIEENGFNKTDDNIYTNDELAAKATIYDDVDDPFILFEPLPRQQEDYLTFAQFPYGFSAQLEKADKDAIDKYESSHGGTYNDYASDPNAEKGAFYYYNVKSDNHCILRTYWMQKEDPFKMRETMLIFDKPTLAIYNFLGNIYLTKEFKDLMQKEGFSYHGYSDRYASFSFYKESMKLQVIIGVTTFDGVADNKPVLNINIFHSDLPYDFNSVRDIENMNNKVKTKDIKQHKFYAKR